MGSQGRHEQSARSDQDNALVLDDSAVKADDDYFKALAKIVNDGLEKRPSPPPSPHRNR